MALEWDSLLAAALAAELRDEFLESRLRAVHFDHGARSVVLYLRDAVLAFRLDPSEGWVLRLPASEPPDEAVPLAASVRRIEAPPDERMLEVDLDKLRGRSRRFRIVVELLPNRWDAVLLEGDDGRIRTVLRGGERGGRSLVRGEAYAPPPALPREGREGPLTFERWLEIVSGGPGADRARRLVRSVAYTSRVNAAALLPDGSDPPRESFRPGWERWTRWRRMEGIEPTLLATDRGPLPYPYPVPGTGGEAVPSILEGMARAAGPEAGTGPRLPSTLLHALEGRLERERKRLGSLRTELDGTPDPEPLRETGDLLLARLGEVPAGRSRVALTGFDGASREVALDPKLPPHENAARYYDRAGRARRARESLPEMIDSAAREVERLEDLLRDARGGRVPASALRESGAGSAEGLDRAGKGRAVLPYRRFRSSGGLEIRVGRNARANDELTFRTSSPGDVWLHARHGAGAHVILRWSGDGPPPGADLREAATLAALHSKARTSGSVPVDWTRRRYVRKPRKAPPGTVVAERVKTLFVEPDPDLPSRLSPDGDTDGSG